MRVYLDACCYNRPFDDQGQLRIRREAEAVLSIINESSKIGRQIIGSEILDAELSQVPNGERRSAVEELASCCSEIIQVTKKVEMRARELMDCGFAFHDALHIVCAETAGADALITTDDRLMRCAGRNKELLRIRVINPVVWMKEHI